MAKQIDNHEEKQRRIERNDSLRKLRDERIKKLERRTTVNKAIPVLIFVSIGASVYSFRLGRRSGYLEGVNAGYVKAGHELVASWREHSEQLRLSRQY